MKPVHPHVRRARAGVATVVVAILFGVLGAAFFRAQVLRSSSYLLTAESNRLRPLDLPPPRGRILDREGRLIAENVPGFSITLLPLGSRDSLVATLDRLAEVLPLDSARLARLLERAGREPGQPLVIEPDASFEELAALEERRAEFPSLFIEARPKRHYNGGASIGHVVGYIGEITTVELESPFYAAERYEQGLIVGKTGIERQYERLLQGLEGVRYVEVDARGRIVGDFAGINTRLAVPGEDIRLSIDLELQEWIHHIFPDTMMGAVVALDPADGSVLALYSAPSYDPNLFVGGIDSPSWTALNTDPQKPLYNKAVLGRFAPASTWKLATASIALDLGLVRPDERMPQACTGSFFFGRTWGCWKPEGHGNITLLEAIQHSCDVYFYQLGLRIGLQRLLDEANRIGFNRTCGIDLPQENPGIFPRGPEYWEEVWGYEPQEGEVLSLAIGQGPNSQTPLKMAQFYVALARDGSAPAPRLFPDGPDPAPEGWRLDLSAEARATMLEGLRRVTAPGGTAHMSSLEHWDLFGKTGTGQNPLSVNGLAEDDAWFAGMAGPRGGAPEIVVVVLVQYGGGGSAVAAPIVAKAADFYLRRRHGIAVDTVQTLGEHLAVGPWPAWAQIPR